MNYEEKILVEAEKKEKEKFVDQLVVIPMECVDIESQMKNLIIDGKRGFLNLNNPEAVKNIDDSNAIVVPYIIYDIEDGEATTKINPVKCRYLFPKYGRRGLTAAEGIALVRRYPEILRNRNLQLIGSCYYTPKKCPVLYLSHNGPKMDWDYIDDIYAIAGKSGVPSCHWMY